MPLLPLWARRRMVKYTVLGVSLYGLYRFVVPDAAFEERMREDEEERARTRTPDNKRMLELAAQGYQFTDITRIIAAERKERYRVLYERKARERREEEARLQMEREKERAETSGEVPPAA